MPAVNVQRSYTRRLSQLLASPDGALALAMMQKLASTRPSANGGERLPRVDGTSLGIWRRTGNIFTRDSDRRDEWHYWADRDEFQPDPDRRLVALIGESAARAYFYDPLTTLAGLTEQAVRAAGGPDDVEVVDLAKTNATAGDIITILLETAFLRPGVSALVIFAGNNWNNVDLELGQLQELAEAVRAGGFSQSRILLHEYIASQAACVLDVAAAVSKVLSAPVILVIPEFNLEDWHEERSVVCPALPSGQSTRWLVLRERAMEELGAGNLAAAGRLARAMADIDGGASPVSQRILAAALWDSDPAAAQCALLAAKDAPVGTFLPHSPRALTSMQQVMREKAAEHGFTVVDLGEEMRQADPGQVPGRNFFLDYCHLNFRGLVLSAATVGSALRGVLGWDESAAEKLSAELAPAAPGGLSTAHFLAALHNAHYGQPGEIVRYHLESALCLDGSAAGLMRDYLDYQTRRAPHWMCRSFQSSTATPQMARYLHFGDARITSKLADYELRSDMVRLLEQHGASVSSSYQELLVTQHSGRTADLLDDASRATTFRERSSHGLGAPRAYFAAPDLRSEFHLVADGPGSRHLSITWRLPAGDPHEGQVLIQVDGEHLASMAVSESWRTVELVIPEGWLHRGDNIIQIIWPLRTVRGDELLARASQSLERGAVPGSLQDYGHIFAFTAHVPAAVPATRADG